MHYSQYLVGWCERLPISKSVPIKRKTETFPFDTAVWFRFWKLFILHVILFSRELPLPSFLPSISPFFGTFWAKLGCIWRTIWGSINPTFTAVLGHLCCSCCYCLPQQLFNVMLYKSHHFLKKAIILVPKIYIKLLLDVWQKPRWTCAKLQMEFCNMN